MCHHELNVIKNQYFFKLFNAIFHFNFQQLIQEIWQLIWTKRIKIIFLVNKFFFKKIKDTVNPFILPHGIQLSMELSSEKCKVMHLGKQTNPEDYFIAGKK